jgi:hypothetical protein
VNGRRCEAGLVEIKSFVVFALSECSMAKCFVCFIKTRAIWPHFFKFFLSEKTCVLLSVLFSNLR